MSESFWFADLSLERSGWQPCLYTWGCAFSFDVWFRTEAECVDWILTIPAGVNVER